MKGALLSDIPGSRYVPGQGGFWGGALFLVCDFRGGQEWMMYNLPAEHYLAEINYDLKGDR